VEQEFRRYMEGYLLAYSFAPARHPDGVDDFLAAFSCQGRGLCPWCNVPWTAETVAHLVDHVVQSVRLGQWIL
jgi:hypothetical protein